MNNHNRNEELETKSNWSYLYQKFLTIDQRMRKNILIGVSMALVVIGTGLLLATIALVKMGGSYIDKKIVDMQERHLES